MSIPTSAYAAPAPSAPIAPWTFERREPGPQDVLIEILYCGICHTDIHMVRDEWFPGMYPMVPGHEIVGKVTKVGSGVTKWKAGDTVGVGVFVDSCRKCPNCLSGEEQYCDEGMTGTYNSLERDGVTPTYGGYSTQITVDENYVVRIPEGLALDATAPLLCAGITTYSPLKHFGVKSGDKVAVVGLGGLGHMAVKFARAMGAEVTVISTSDSKKADAERLGAHHFMNSREEGVFETNKNQFDFILNTISADHDYNAYLGLLKLDGTMCLVGLPNPQPVAAFSLVTRRRRLAGSMVGSIAETQEMLDFCAKHGVVSDVEVVPASYINEAYARMMKSDVRYRFVIDIATMK